MHCDLKPENVCIASASRRKFKIIDVRIFHSNKFVSTGRSLPFGQAADSPRDTHRSDLLCSGTMSTFLTCKRVVIVCGTSLDTPRDWSDHLCVHVSPPSPGAPEVMLGLPWGEKVDQWGVGCILACACAYKPAMCRQMSVADRAFAALAFPSELVLGQQLFHGPSVEHVLAAQQAVLGSVPEFMVRSSATRNLYFTRAFGEPLKHSPRSCGVSCMFSSRNRWSAASRSVQRQVTSTHSIHQATL